MISICCANCARTRSPAGSSPLRRSSMDAVDARRHLHVPHLADGRRRRSCISPTSYAASSTHFIARLSLGNTPDQPSNSGTVSRVVSGVTIHPLVRARPCISESTAAGTKTALVLIDSDGTIRATHFAPGSYYLTIGLEALGTLLADGVSAVLAKAAVGRDEVDFAFFGLPAYGEDTTLLGSLEPAAAAVSARPMRYLCGNDMICGWAGSLLCRDGISIVAGTGSICYGERNGAIARMRRLGRIVQRRGVRLLDRMPRPESVLAHERRQGGAGTVVRASSGNRLSLAEDLDLCAHVFSRLEGDRARIAQLSKLVTQAARGRRRRRPWPSSARPPTELALMVDATRRQLGFSAAEPVAVSYSGGVFEQRRRACWWNTLPRPCNAFRPGYRVSEPALPPAIGAALYAAKRHGQPAVGCGYRAAAGAKRAAGESSSNHEDARRRCALTACGGLLLTAGGRLRRRAALHRRRISPRWTRSTSMCTSIRPTRR